MPRGSGPRGRCAERLKLADVVAKAVQGMCSAKTEFDRAVKERRDSSASSVVLAKARKAELAAVALLDRHRKEHGC